MKEIQEIICTVALALVMGAAISLAFVLDEQRKDRAIPERDLTELRAGSGNPMDRPRRRADAVPEGAED